MDVRGPTRAAAKRLTTGMVVACAAAAVGAPVAMAGTVSNVHSKPPLDPATQLPGPEVPVPAGYNAGPGESNSVTLGFVNGDAVFGDPGVGGTGVTMSGTTGGYDVDTQEDTCFPDETFAHWTCPQASKVSV